MQRQMVACVVGVCLGVFASANEDDDMQERERLRKAITEATTSREAGQQMRKFYALATREGAMNLEADADLGIALHAAWAMAGDKDVKVQASGAKAFLQLLKDRIGVPVPKRWLARLPEPFGKAIEDIGRVDASGWTSNDASDLVETGLRIWIPSGCRISRGIGSIVWSRNDVNVVIKDHVLSKAKKDYALVVGTSVNAHWDKERAIVAVYDVFGGHYPLITIDPHSGEALRQCEVWGVGTENLSAVTGGHRHQQILVVSETRVVVFGVAGAYYVEAFDRKSGAVIARFASNCWFQK